MKANGKANREVLSGPERGGNYRVTEAACIKVIHPVCSWGMMEGGVNVRVKIGVCLTGVVGSPKGNSGTESRAGGKSLLLAIRQVPFDFQGSGLSIDCSNILTHLYVVNFLPPETFIIGHPNKPRLFLFIDTLASGLFHWLPPVSCAWSIYFDRICFY